MHGINQTANGSQPILHSDNGGPMKGKTMQAMCYGLGILCTYNRPRTSNDNAQMEASFNLLKHGKIVEIPSYFTSIEQAKAWCTKYYDWYNKEHRHSAICYITPSACYHGEGEQLMEKRNKLIKAFYDDNKAMNKKRDNAGGERADKQAFIWKMPKKVEVMPFYTRRQKIPQGMENTGYEEIEQ